MKQTLYLVRHGEPKITIEGSKGSLTKNGVSQASEVADTLKLHINSKSKPTILYSMVDRCAETAQIIGAQLQTTPLAAPLRLKNANKLSVKGTHSAYRKYISSYARVGIESPDAYARRVLKLVESTNDPNVVLVSNEVPIRLLLQYLSKTSYTDDIKHGCCIRLTSATGFDNAIIERVL